MWNGGITNAGRGRGGSVDRGGRGRNARGSLYSSHYSRGVSFDDSGDGPRIDSQSFQVCNLFHFIKLIAEKSKLIFSHFTEIISLNTTIFVKIDNFLYPGKKSPV